MTTLDNGLPSVLRRRAKTIENLEAAGRVRLAAGFTWALRRAADELAVRKRMDTHGEEALVELIADNRRLRSFLVTMRDRVLSDKTLDELAVEGLKLGTTAVLKATAPIGNGRLILALEVTDKTRAEVEALMAAKLDAHYNAQEVTDAEEPEEPNTSDEHEIAPGERDGGDRGL